jgi:hypothetical protein
MAEQNKERIIRLEIQQERQAITITVFCNPVAQFEDPIINCIMAELEEKREKSDVWAECFSTAARNLIKDPRFTGSEKTLKILGRILDTFHKVGICRSFSKEKGDNLTIRESLNKRVVNV